MLHFYGAVEQKYYKINWRGNYKTDGGVLANQAIHSIRYINLFIWRNSKFQRFCRV